MAFSQIINDATLERFTGGPVTAFDSIDFAPVRFSEFVGGSTEHHVWVRMTKNTTRNWDPEKGWHEVSTRYVPIVWVDLGKVQTMSFHQEFKCALSVAFKDDEKFGTYRPAREHMGEWAMDFSAWLQTERAADAIGQAVENFKK